MALVVDASLAAAWFLPDEQNDAADRVMAELDKNPGRAPSQFWFETRNLFIMAERRGRLAPGEATATMAQLRGFPIIDEGTGNDRLAIRRLDRRLGERRAGRGAVSRYDRACIVGEGSKGRSRAHRFATPYASPFVPPTGPGRARSGRVQNRVTLCSGAQ